MKKLRLHLVVALSLLFLMPAFARISVYDYFKRLKNFTTFIEAVEREDLPTDYVTLLSEDGDVFTIFIPDNAAFERLFDELGVDGLDDLDAATLDAVLKMHVLDGRYLSRYFKNSNTATTFLGEEIVFIRERGRTIVDPNGREIPITGVNCKARNGYIHNVGRVILPNIEEDSMQLPATVVDIATSDANFSTLVSALTREDLSTDPVGVLSGEGPFTVFAPTNDAFASLLEELGVDGLDAIDAATLEDVLLAHVVAGNIRSTDLEDGMEVVTVGGDTLIVQLDSTAAFLEDPNGRLSEIITTDLEAENGVVHAIASVLLPKAEEDTTMMVDGRVLISEDEELGQLLTDAEGNTLYFFTLDAQEDFSACEGGCAEAWPVFYRESIVAGEGLDSEDFSSFMRADGQMQTTYKGWPLYYWFRDTVAGMTTGEGVNDVWYVAKPDYSIMLLNDQLTGMDGVDYTGQYEPGEEVVQYFVDAYGRTIYIWSNDNFDQNNYSVDSIFESRNDIWPIYEETMGAYPSSLEDTLFGSIEVSGRNQLTYNGWPLYYWRGDEVRGDNLGVSVPAPGVWPVAVAGLEAAPAATVATVVDVARSNDDFSTLVSALSQDGLSADYEELLKGEGPFTVFAPTNEAFAALLEELDGISLVEIDAAILEDILLAHVVAGRVLSSDLSDGMQIVTMGEDTLTVSIDSVVSLTDQNGRVTQVTMADLEADNGVVHAIDQVILPLIDFAMIDTTGATAAKTLNMDVYPNPSSNFINVNTKEQSGQAIIRIFDRMGNTVMVDYTFGADVKDLDISGLNAGIYYIQVSQNGKQASRQLLVVE